MCRARCAAWSTRRRSTARSRGRSSSAPAVELAAKGFPLSYAQAQGLRGTPRGLSSFPESNRIFLKGGKFYEAGEVFVQPELGRTLDRIARLGAKDFYEGETAQLLAKDMKEHGGLITVDDLKKYAAIERKPLTGAYRGYTIVTAPPPSSGGVGVLQMLGVLEGTGFEKAGAGSATSVHYMTEAMRRYFADRSRASRRPRLRESSRSPPC